MTRHARRRTLHASPGPLSPKDVMTHRLLVTAVGCAAALCLAFSGSALADSIVYVSNGNVWLTSPDGARSYQVTFDGGYDSPSQADDGTIVAVQRRQIVRMDRSGRRIGAPVAAMGTDPGAGGQEFYGPYEARVSPDGRKVAYWYGQYEERL